MISSINEGAIKREPGNALASVLLNVVECATIAVDTGQRQIYKTCPRSHHIGFFSSVSTGPIWKMTKSFSINFFSFVYFVHIAITAVFFFSLVQFGFMSASDGVCVCVVVVFAFVNAFLSINCDARFYEFNGQM